MYNKFKFSSGGLKSMYISTKASWCKEILMKHKWKLDVYKQSDLSIVWVGWGIGWALLIKLLINAGVERSAWGHTIKGLQKLAQVTKMC